MTVDIAQHTERVRRASEAMRQSSASVRLDKDTSNLFRDRTEAEGAKLDVRSFKDVLSIDANAPSIDVEGMCPFGDLVDATLAHDLLPPVVPQLKSITIGGAISGLGIESSSFRYGLVHETVEEIEVLLSDGEVVVATPTNNHKDLFFGIPNSFGTLGYVLRTRIKGVRTKPYVRLQHIRHTDRTKFFEDVAAWCARDDVDFVDGSVFSADEMYLTLGFFVDDAPYTSDYTFENIFYKSIQTREEDYLTTHDYIWRWDTDWFWCSKVFFLENPVVRRMFGRKRLNSTYYMKLLRMHSKMPIWTKMFNAMGYYREAVIQDVDVRIGQAVDFFDFFIKDIPIRPFWICPFRSPEPKHHFTTWPVDTKALYVNFGFWDGVSSREKHEKGHYNRLVEAKLAELDGTKSLYSEAYYSEDDFWRNYNGEQYRELKAKYDPSGRLKDLYQKCVRRS